MLIVYFWNKLILQGYQGKTYNLSYIYFYRKHIETIMHFSQIFIKSYLDQKQTIQKKETIFISLNNFVTLKKCSQIFEFNSSIQATTTLSLVVILIRIRLALAKPSGLIFAIDIWFGVLFSNTLTSVYVKYMINYCKY